MRSHGNQRRWRWKFITNRCQMGSPKIKSLWKQMSERESRNNFMASCSIPAVWRIYHHGYIQKHIIISYHTDVSSAPNVKMPCFFTKFLLSRKRRFLNRFYCSGTTWNSNMILIAYLMMKMPSFYGTFFTHSNISLKCVRRNSSGTIRSDFSLYLLHV